jgi:hypothetical protein
MVDLLPGRLRTNPRWLAAGAVAGAMGCVAAATLITPAAIAALPLWAGLGAAVSAALPHVSLGRTGTAPVEAENDFTESVRSAALFALLLELQGRDESTITRIIDQVADHEDVNIDSLDTARNWLDAMARRFQESRVSEPA